MMTTDATDTPPAGPPLGLSLHDQLGPLLEGWANVEYVRLVNRSTGQRTTDTVSRDGLLDLMRAVQAAERERCAVAAWNYYMDICQKRGLPAAMCDEWCAAGAIRGPNDRVKRAGTAPLEQRG